MNPDGSINWKARAAAMREKQKRDNKLKIERMKSARSKTRKVGAPKKKVADIRFKKKVLDSAWSKAVRERDGHKCVLCGSVKTPQAHHWYFTKAQGNNTRWEVDNGVCLCYACHMFKIHQGNAFYIEQLKEKMVLKIGQDRIDALVSLRADNSISTYNLIKGKYAEFGLADAV